MRLAKATTGSEPLSRPHGRENPSRAYKPTSFESRAPHHLTGRTPVGSGNRLQICHFCSGTSLSLPLCGEGRTSTNIHARKFDSFASRHLVRTYRGIIQRLGWEPPKLLTQVRVLLPLPSWKCRSAARASALKADMGESLRGFESLHFRHFWKGRHALVPCTDLLNPGPLKRSASSIRKAIA